MAQAKVLLAVLAVLSALGAAAVRAETTIRVLETYPAGDSVTLPTNETFYVRIEYTTDEPVRIWARPYFEGTEVRAGSNPSRAHTGSGEALGWFFFHEPGMQVDEIRIKAGDGTPSGTQALVSYPVRITSATLPAVAASQPEWVVALRSEEQRLQREEFEARMSTPPSAGEMLFMNAFMLAVLGLGILGIVAPVWAMRRWSGGWRVAAAVPGVILGFVVLRIVFDTARDPTSHNLWPFEILQFGLLSLVLMGVLLAARKLSGAAAKTA